jgi:tetratricopeptide (TPR) repeat protein
MAEALTPALARRRGRRSLASESVLCAALMFGSPALAAPTTADDVDPNASPAGESLSTGDPRVVVLNEEGHALYAVGDYRRAVERFLQAYAIEPDPNLLFNVASCYEELGDSDAALEKYVAFLDGVGGDHEGRPRAEKAIERLVTHREASEAAQKPTSPKPEPAPPLQAAPRPPASPPAQPARDPAWLPWVGLGGGAALGALGVTLYAMGASDHGDLSGARGFGDPNAVTPLTRSQADDLVRSGNAKKAVGATLASVGGALAASYLVWWWIDPVAETSVRRVDVSIDRSEMSVTLIEQF